LIRPTVDFQDLSPTAPSTPKPNRPRFVPLKEKKKAKVLNVLYNTPPFGEGVLT
jgi:hypothetical protein